MNDGSPQRVASFNKERLKLIRFSLGAGRTRGRPLEAPRRIPVAAGMVGVVMLVVFAAVWVAQFSKLHFQPGGGVTDLMGTLFSLFWLMGWTVGVLFLAVITLVLLFFRESACIADGKLFSTLRVGPVLLEVEYELARIKNLRVTEESGGKSEKICFEYDGMPCTLGNMMAPEVAARNLKVLQAAVAGEPAVTEPEPALKPAPAAARPVAPKIIYRTPAARGLPWPSMLALIAANLVPLVMVLLGDWTLEQVIMLFWAESAVIGAYTLLKMAVVAKWWSVFPGMFFVGHFGGFMAIHFMFIYVLFLRGTHPGMADPAALPELVRLFAPLQWALLALVLSHGISFVMNFMGQREYESERVQSLMSAPYGRIVVMQLTLILGGWLVMLVHNPVPALAMLVVFKIIADLSAHYGERKTTAGSDAVDHS